MCYTSALPDWATATIAGIRASCAMFGSGICNATGNLSATIRRVEAEAYARWAFNHTNQWIDALFAATYRKESGMYEALSRAGSVPRLVAAEDGLNDEEVRAMREEDAMRGNSTR